MCCISLQLTNMNLWGNRHAGRGIYLCNERGTIKGQMWIGKYVNTWTTGICPCNTAKVRAVQWRVSGWTDGYLWGVLTTYKQIEIIFKMWPSQYLRPANLTYLWLGTQARDVQKDVLEGALGNAGDGQSTDFISSVHNKNSFAAHRKRVKWVTADCL